MKALRITLTTLLIMVLASIAPAALTQVTFPAKTIRIIAPVPPGSPPDVVARVIADQLSRDFGQPVIVENRPGANQTIGLGFVAAAAPDGYTLGMVSLPTAVVPSIVARMPFDTMRDLAPVREIAWTSNVLVVNNSSDIGSVRDLIAKAKAQPGRVTFASGGNGTPAHVIAELFRDTAGIDLLHVPFRGAVEGVAALVGGHVDLMFASAGAVEGQVRAGKLKALAQTTATRLPGFKDVPTLIELGFTQVAVRDWQGIVAPAGTPAVVLNRLSTAIGQALLRQETQDRLRSLALYAVDDSDPHTFGQFMESELRRWAAVAKTANLQAE